MHAVTPPPLHGSKDLEPRAPAEPRLMTRRRRLPLVCPATRTPPGEPCGCWHHNAHQPPSQIVGAQWGTPRQAKCHLPITTSSKTSHACATAHHQSASPPTNLSSQLHPAAPIRPPARPHAPPTPNCHRHCRCHCLDPFTKAQRDLVQTWIVPLATTDQIAICKAPSVLGHIINDKTALMHRCEKNKLGRDTYLTQTLPQKNSQKTKK